jgi:hypothetical protein
MHATTTPLLVSLLVTPLLTQSAQSAPTQPVAVAPLRPDHGGMHAGGFCSQRDEEGSWDNVRLYPADYVRNATTDAAHQGLAANRSANRGGVQGAGSELRKGRQGEDATVGHVVVLGGDRRPSCSPKTRRGGLRPTWQSLPELVRKA